MFGSLLHAETVTVTLITRGAPDADGVPSESTTSIDVEGCNVQPVTTAEVVDGSTVLVTGRWRVSGPLTEQILPGSRATWRGRAFDIDGEPEHYRGTGALDHTEFVLIAHRG